MADRFPRTCDWSATSLTLVITVGAYEAKTRLSELLQRVQEGETVTITKHGHPVARIVGAETERPSTEQVRDEVRRLNEGLPPVGIEEILASIHEGHRY